MHYDIISALIKSIRGSDPNAAVYWLARLLQSGEDIKFIARRLIISASEDIGNAQPSALILAQSTFDAVQSVGMPEARIVLSQCVIHLATAPKSNASYLAINQALKEVEKSANLPVPLHLRNAPTPLAKDLGYGQAYQYPHDYAENFVAQKYLPDELEGTRFFEPGNNPKENRLRSWLKSIWKGKYGY